MVNAMLPDTPEFNPSDEDPRAWIPIPTKATLHFSSRSLDWTEPYTERSRRTCSNSEPPSANPIRVARH